MSTSKLNKKSEKNKDIDIIVLLSEANIFVPFFYVIFLNTEKGQDDIQI